MSEPQTEIDAEPTGGPWEFDLELGAADSFVWGPDGDAVAIMGARASVEEKKANARLIAAAGTAAQEAKEMGYDPVSAVQALPELLDTLRAIAVEEERPNHNAHRISQWAKDALARAEVSRDE
jgi:hypothetical protein